MKDNVKRTAFLMLLPLLTQALFAQEQPEDSAVFTSSGKLTLQVVTLPAAKLIFTEQLTFPLLQGESPLTEDNNIALALTAEISPISLNGLAEVIWTPAAFLLFSTGGRIGSGWNLNLFGSNIYGIGLNRAGIAGNSEHSGSAFDGFLWKVQTGVTVQFDSAALSPGEWHHVVVRSYHEINYRGYSRAKDGESWYYEDDDGENCNGFNYFGNLLVGYEMPLFIDLAALLVEADLYLYDTPGRERWGDDKIRWTLSGAFGFSFGKQIDLMLAVQFRTRSNYQESNWQELYYRNRSIDASKPLRFEFYRIAAILTYSF